MGPAGHILVVNNFQLIIFVQEDNSGVVTKCFAIETTLNQECDENVRRSKMKTILRTELLLMIILLFPTSSLNAVGRICPRPDEMQPRLPRRSFSELVAQEKSPANPLITAAAAMPKLMFGGAVLGAWVDWNWKDNCGKTPFYLAFFMGRSDCGDHGASDRIGPH